MRIVTIRKKNNLNQKLRDAFEALDAERVKALLAAGADKKRRVRNEMLMSSIGEPCFESNAERTKRMKLLLANGANPNWIDPDPSWFDTPLLESLMSYNFEQAQILIDNGAHVDIKDKSGKDALAHAADDEEKMDLFARAIDDSNKFLRRKIVVMSK